MNSAKSLKVDLSQITSFQRWLVVLTASSLFFYTFIQMNMLNSFSEVLIRDFSMNAEQFGHLVAMYFYANFLLVFPAGLLVDRISSRKIILTAMSLSIISIIGFSLCTHLWAASIFRLLSGIGGAFAFLSCIRLASRWFPPKKMAFVTGCVVTFAMLGGMVAQTPMVLLSGLLGSWRWAMLTMGILGIMMIVPMWFIVHDISERTEATKNAPLSEKNLGFWKSISWVFINPYNWLAGLYITLMNLPIFVLGGSWGDLYLMQTHGQINRVEAATISSMIFFGTIFGSPAIGWISDNLRRRILPMLVAALLSIGNMLLILYLKDLNFIALAILFFTLGLVTSAQILGYPVITELNSSKVTGTALSVASLLIMASGFIFPPLYGYLLNMHWNHLIVHHIPIYALYNYNFAMVLTIIIPFVVSVLLTLMLKETHGKPCTAETHHIENAQ